MNRIHPYVHVPYPVVLAHQGSSANAPCNTLPAFRLAIQEGADSLESDLHWTRDGAMVLCHDETVDRTSNGSGAIANMTLRELKQLDFGFRWSMDGGKTYPFRGRGIQIPTLSDVLQEFPGIRVNLDVKPRTPKSLQQLIAEIYSYNAASRVLIASFHHNVLQQFRTMNQEIATSASVLETAFFCGRLWTKLHFTDKLPYCALQVPATRYGIPVVTREFVELAHHLGKRVHVWTIDDEIVMRNLLDIGVDGIVTNRPKAAVDIRTTFLNDRSA